jgi:hypothetical protein
VEAMMAEQAVAEEKTNVAFRRFLKSVLVVDTILLLFVTFGFVLPVKPVCDPATGGLPAGSYDDSAKISPFTLPAPERAPVKADIPRITARGNHPTFVPAAPPEDRAEAHDLGVTPASALDDSIAARPAGPITAQDSSETAPARVESVSAPHTT